MCCAVEDLLEHLGHRLAPLLPALLALVLRMLSEATADLAAPAAPGGGAAMQVDGGEAAGAAAAPAPPADTRFREIRASCLKLLSQLWIRFPSEHVLPIPNFSMSQQSSSKC